MAMKKKAAAPEPAGESAPMWIVSFADLVTLMMSFFVVLYALKQGGKEQQLETTAAIKAKFGWKPDLASSDELDRVGRRMLGIDGPPLEDFKGNSTKEMKGADGSSSEVETIRAGKDIVTGGKLIFQPGQAVLSQAAKDTLVQIAKQVRGHNNVLMIKGHVSADELTLVPDDTDGQALSYRRASVVIDELARLGIDRRVMRAVPCGSFEPVKTGAYEAAELQVNRRAEVFTTDYTASDYFPIMTVPPTSTQTGTLSTKSKPAETGLAAKAGG